MNKILSILTGLLVLASYSLKASNNLIIGNPRTGNYGANARVSEMDILVKPQGLYAQVELIFSIQGTGSYGNYDTLESVLNFELPANSFVHDSWLWLDANTIIVADIVERNQATQTYNNIVQRRQDPSLLVKKSATTYQLSIFPHHAGQTFARKVKLVYSVPFSWNGNKAIVPLPVEMAMSGTTKPVITMQVQTDNIYTQPAFAETAFSSLVTSGTSNAYMLSIGANSYATGLTLTYMTAVANGSLLFAHPTSGGEGIYELMVQPGAFGGAPSPRHITFVLDPESGNNSYTVYRFWEVMRYLRGHLLSRLNPEDSFNIFYVHNNAVHQAFAGWQSADTAHISAALNGLPALPSNEQGQYEMLFKQALAFCKTGPAAGTQTMVLSGNRSLIGATPASLNQMAGNIQSFTGPLANPVHVINYSSYTQNLQTGLVTGNQPFFSRLIQAAGGSFNSYSKFAYDNVSRTYIGDLDIRALLQQLTFRMAYHTSLFDIQVPVTNGFVYSRQAVSPEARFGYGGPFLETGKYFGTLQAGGNIQVQYMSPLGYASYQSPLGAVASGSGQLVKAWVNGYINSLMTGSNSGYREALDSSINNRVLCDLTAFLALETGDTLKVPAKGNVIILPISVSQPPAGLSAVRCYPNPFASALNIRYDGGIEELEIMDITGRKILRTVWSTPVTTFVWNGQDANGGNLPAGLYLIRVTSGKETATVKVMKQ